MIKNQPLFYIYDDGTVEKKVNNRIMVKKTWVEKRDCDNSYKIKTIDTQH